MEKLIKMGWIETALVVVPVLAFTHMVFDIILAL